MDHREAGRRRRVRRLAAFLLISDRASEEFVARFLATSIDVSLEMAWAIIAEAKAIKRRRSKQTL